MPTITVGDPVELVTRIGKPGDAPVVHGIVVAITDDRASIQWVDGLTSSVRAQFLRVLVPQTINRLAILRLTDRAWMRRRTVHASRELSTIFRARGDDRTADGFACAADEIED